jgi:hypothetical protein
MRPKLDPQAHSILVALKIDANRLFERLKYRQIEYLGVFALKRSREHFKEVFKSRYDQLLVSDLKLIDSEVLIEADRFYSEVDKLKWYLYHTEEMPGFVENKVDKALKILEPSLESLNLYINAQLGYQDPK